MSTQLSQKATRKAIALAYPLTTATSTMEFFFCNEEKKGVDKKNSTLFLKKTVLDGEKKSTKSKIHVVNAGSCNGPTLAHLIPRPSKSSGQKIAKVTVMFRSHYGEPPLVLPLPKSIMECSDGDGTFEKRSITYELEYDPFTRVWTNNKEYI